MVHHTHNWAVQIVEAGAVWTVSSCRVQYFLEGFVRLGFGFE